MLERSSIILKEPCRISFVLNYMTPSRFSTSAACGFKDMLKRTGNIFFHKGADMSRNPSADDKQEADLGASNSEDSHKYNKQLNEIIDKSWKEAIRGFSFSNSDKSESSK